MSSNPQMPPPMGPGGMPVKKKTSPIVWILVGIGGFFLLCIIAVVGLVGYGVHKAKQAGFDSELAKKNPQLAAAKLALSFSPNVKIISSDDDRGTITVRNTETNKIVTMTFDPQQKKFIVSEQGGESSTMTLGGGDAKLPSWIPDYPGSKPEATMSAHDVNGDSGTFHFVTKDSVDQVTKFYEGKLKDAGMKITNSFSGQSSGSEGGVMVAEDESKHNVMVTVGTDSGGTTVMVVYSTKK